MARTRVRSARKLPIAKAPLGEPVQVITPDKPSIEEVQNIILKKQQIKKLTEELEMELIQLVENFGAERFDYKLAKADKDGKKYLKFELVDNVSLMQNGVTIFTSVPTKFATFKASLTIKEPK